MAEPILKWAGGKRQLLDELLERFPAEGIRCYHEPMVGGGALFFHLEPEDGTINDTNPRLVNFYEQVRDHPSVLIDNLETFSEPWSPPDTERDFSETSRAGKPIENYYYQQREIFNRRPNGEPFDDTEEAALLLYLNRTCFNGLYRENSAGEFNVPKGSYDDPEWIFEDRIEGASAVLAETEIFNEGFEYVLDVAKPKDLVYFDPPYEPMSPTANFTDYSSEGFDRDDQERLLETAKELDDKEVYVILSNSGVMHEMYEDAGFKVKTEGATRAINSDGENRGEVDEIVATNVPVHSQRGPSQLTISDY